MNYDLYRGWPASKTYGGGAAGPAYTYTAAGRLASRTWARGITTSYAYNWAGELMRVDYSDSTPDVGYGYDRLGRRVTVTNNTTLICSLAYNDAGELLSETRPSGPLSGLAVTNGYDAWLRRTAVGLDTQPATLSQFRYDAASRLAVVTNGVNVVGYSYVANSPLVGQVLFTNNGAQRMVTTKNYDNLNRLSSISSSSSQLPTPVSFAYAYNSAKQRTAVTNADNSRWAYGYDALGQVTSGKKYWSDATPVAGQQFEYTFDDIGNRKTTGFGGDQTGANLRYANYTNNSLNQITSRGVPGFVNLLGEATNTATVTLWSSSGSYASTSRKGNYFRGELQETNTSARWLTITNLAILNNGTNADIVTNITGNVFLAQTPESFGYDADGNVTSDGRWTYTWDAENRLVKVENLSGNPTASKRKVEWTYDYAGRRIRQTTSDGSSGSYVVTEDLKFVSDRWRHIAELNATNNALVRSYTWGLDLSGSLGGAGGVGGLLALNSVANGAHFYAYDGNGNASALVKASDGTESARYEYGPFGEVLRATGPMAMENRFQYSTKRCDPTTDLLLYEHRVFRTDVGKWLSCDPIEESGGLHLYGFVSNSPLVWVDSDGLAPYDSLDIVAGRLSTIGASDPQPAPYYDAWRMFLHLLAGDLGDTFKLSSGTLDEAKRRIIETSGRTIRADIQSILTCGRSGTRTVHDYQKDFSIDPEAGRVHIGQWQLWTRSTVKWQCGEGVQIAGKCYCKCSAEVQTKAHMGKTYTFRGIGYNEANSTFAIQVLNFIAFMEQSVGQGNLDWPLGPGYYVAYSFDLPSSLSFAKTEKAHAR